MFRYVDVHSHISFPEFEADRLTILEGMKEQGIATITVGVDKESSEQAVWLSESNEYVFAAVGIHPHEAQRATFNAKEWVHFLERKRVVAVGECGLDFYRSEVDAPAKEAQRSLFAAQLAFAGEHDKPLMLHGRPSAGSMDAYEEMLRLIDEAQARFNVIRGNIHFFVGTPSIAAAFNDRGFTISLTGVITFTPEYDDVVKAIPLTELHVETDSPYATPAPHRGKRNDPRYVPLILKRIAEIKGVPEVDVQASLRGNAQRIFGI